jgi:signal transduction histidine kinase
MNYSPKYFLVLFFILSPILYSQQNTADSLAKELENVSGEKKVDLLIELSDIYQYINTTIAIEYASNAVELASAINYKKGLATSYGSLGYCYVNLDNPKALEYTQKALKLRTELDDKVGISTSLNVMGVIFYYKGDFLNSIDYHLKSLKMREDIGDEIKIATSYNNIALVHIALENYHDALDYLNKALTIRIKTENKRGIAIVYDNIGDVYSKMGNYEKAFECFDKSLSINKEIGNKKSAANSYFNIAVVYRNLSDFSNALKYYYQSLSIYNDLDEKNGIANVENGIASVYNMQGSFQQAIEHASIAMLNAVSINTLGNISISSKILQNSYEKIGDYKNAYKYAVTYQNSTDTLNNSEKFKRLTKMELDYKIEKIKKEQELELKKQETYITYLIISLFFSIIIVAIIVFSFSLKQRLNTKLKLLNKQLVELNSTKDRFFSIIAHDLRGPFNGLLGVSNLLASDIKTLTKEEIEFFSKLINDSLKKQFELLNDLLEWSRLQNGTFSLKYESINLHSTLNEAIKPLELLASQKTIKLHNEINKELLLNADKNMIELVLRNLISNGIKFTNEGGLIKVSALQNDIMTEITVSDNGVGLTQEDIDKLFRIDIHHSTTGTNNEMGTGLGLILCKEIIEKHSGEIRIESKPNQETKIIFTIPSNIPLPK